MERRLALGCVAVGDDEGEERMPADLDRDIRTGEQQRAAAERVRDRDGHQEAGEHDREHEQPHDDRVRVEHVRDPGRVVPRPPDDEQDEQRSCRAVPGQLAEQQMRDLGDREHEDEVVEQLEVRGVLLLVGGGFAQVATHGRATLATTAAAQ